MKDYSKKEFLRDVSDADSQRSNGIIDDKTYRSKMEYFAKSYGPRKKFTKEILNNRNINK